MSKPLPAHLVVLKFTQNDCYTEIVKTYPPDLRIDLKAGTWRWHQFSNKIGHADIPSRDHTRHNWVIGVFDARDLDHLKRMTNAAASIAADGARTAIDFGC